MDNLKNFRLVKHNFSSLVDIVSQSKDHLEMLHWSRNILDQWFPKWAVAPLVDTPDEEMEEKK